MAEVASSVWSTKQEGSQFLERGKYVALVTQEEEGSWTWSASEKEGRLSWKGESGTATTEEEAKRRAVESLAQRMESNGDLG